MRHANKCVLFSSDEEDWPKCYNVTAPALNNMSLLLPIIPAGSPSTKKFIGKMLQLFATSLLFPTPGSESQDFCLLGVLVTLHYDKLLWTKTRNVLCYNLSKKKCTKDWTTLQNFFGSQLFQVSMLFQKTNHPKKMIWFVLLDEIYLIFSS